MALISLQAVSLGFGGVLLLEEINLQIEDGEWIRRLGRNGLGKNNGGWEKPIRQLHILLKI